MILAGESSRTRGPRCGDHRDRGEELLNRGARQAAVIKTSRERRSAACRSAPTKDAADILLREEGYEQFVMISPNSLRLPPGMPGNANTTGVLNTIIEWI